MHRRITGKLVIATHNPGKLAEMRELLAPLRRRGGIGRRTRPRRARRDRRHLSRQCADQGDRRGARPRKLPAFADDSGLVVDALDGAPGIYSARWAGPNKDFTAAMTRIERLLQERGATTPAQRKAHFVSALCVAWPDDHLEEVEARVDGTLVWPPRGTAGFGYDPAFLPDGHTRTFGEMTSIEKHGLPPLGLGLSHRARAFVKLAEICLEPSARQQTSASASTCTGRFACRNVRIAISTAMSGMRRSTRSALRAPLRARSKPPRRARRAARYRRSFSAAARRR